MQTSSACEPSLHLGPADRDACVPVRGCLALAKRLGAVGIAALADRQVRVLLAQRHGGIERGDLSLSRDRAWFRLRPLAILGKAAQHAIQFCDVLGRGAAAAAHDRDAVLDHEALEPCGEVARAKRIAGLALDQLGQAGVRQHRDRPRPAARQIGHVLGHLLRAGGAVQADDRHVERADDGRRRADVGADQHGAGGLDGDLDHERQLAAGFAHRAARAVDRCLGLERILAGLAQDHVGAAGDQASGLHRERILERAVGNVAERGQAGAGPDRTDHEARPAVVREAGDRLVSQLRAALIDLERPLRQLELAERDWRTAEGVGLDGIGAGAQIAEVDVRNHVRAGEIEHLGAVLLVPEVGFDRQVARVDLGAHGTVEQQHAPL